MRMMLPQTQMGLASSHVGPWLSENEADSPAVWKAQAL